MSEPRMNQCVCSHGHNNHFSHGKKPCAHCLCEAFTPLYTKQEVELRKLRMWHWRQVLEATRKRNDPKYNSVHRAKAKFAWNLHMGAVQLLNEFLPHTTAEQDCTQEDRKKK